VFRQPATDNQKCNRADTFLHEMVCQLQFVGVALILTFVRRCLCAGSQYVQSSALLLSAAAAVMLIVDRCACSQCAVWFGNLVSPDWWSGPPLQSLLAALLDDRRCQSTGLWLNESFATCWAGAIVLV
jgi:hypothetical protein